MFGLWDADATVAEKLVNTGLTIGFIIVVAIIVVLAAAILRPSVVQIPGVGIFKFGRKKKPTDTPPEKDLKPVPSLIPSVTFNNDHLLVPIKDRPSLLHHRFFKLMESAASPAFLARDDGEFTDKDAINLTFLRDCKFKVFREGMREFFADLESHDGEGLSKLPAAINRMVKDYEAMAKTIPIQLPSGRLICGVPPSYMGKFNLWHSDHARFALESVDRVLADRFYPDWWFRGSAALEYLNMAFELTITDGNKTLPLLNGDLDADIEAMTRDSCE